ncbi:MAG: IclR family transcriptional regulator [Sphaerochaeta sp.]|jgi:DNA-binding IclR family transcriptional regulator|nr:IclR family transcriptional regulator [Sphaerochaeta sp.]MCH3918916.1 IclR family transcriptional regulator [Sphaerochaeta sp.]MCI2046017.1 IclR family transcriptional regulator [Sphaerochaeta sp.]MCI2077103.1 IclR family transcriptional regulator [Sphaerochaeta sp.]
MDDKPSTPVRSVDRALAIIEVLSSHPKGLGLLDLSREVSLNKTTTYRLLCAIMNHGWVTKDATTGKYRLTLMLFELGSRVSARTNVLTIARPYLEDLSAQFRETVHLVIRDGSDVVYLYKEDSLNRSVKMGSQVGNRYPMYCTGVGKAILAYLSEEDLEEVWKSSHVVARTQTTITSLDAMKKELAETRKRGWAVDNEENEIGVRCVAAPILSRKGYPVASISIASSVFHITKETIGNYAEAVMDTAKIISEQLGL